MDLLPYVLHELIADQSRRPGPVSHGPVYDQHFGLGLENLAVTGPPALNLPAIRAGYIRPWRYLPPADSGVSSFKTDDKEFSARLDVTHFKPEELKVSVDDQGYIKVEGSHEEKSDEHGYISRQFTRRYKLPEDAIPDTLASNLSSDGVLTLHAAKKPKELKGGREIKIVTTNQPAALKVEKKKPEEPKQKHEEPKKK